MSARIKAVAYLRMSSDKQEKSIEGQRAEVQKFANANGYKIIREYRDEGISGAKSEERKDFQRLIDDAQRGDFQAVLCWDQDRFSRFPMLEAAHYWYLLDRAGVHLATVAQGRISFGDLGSYLSATVTQHGKSEFLKDLARNSVRGQRRRMAEGKWHGKAPYGYKLSEGRSAIGDPVEVKAVRRIFDLRVKGYGLKAIAAKLNTEGIRSPRGAEWHYVVVGKLLASRAYCGDTCYGAHATGRYQRIAAEVTTIKDTHKAIIDRETWGAVNGIKKRKRRAHGRGGEGAPLAGLVVCGCCGAPMYSRTVGKSERYFCGANYQDASQCGPCAVARGPLLKAVAAKLREHLLLGSPEQLEAAIQRELDRQRQPTVDRKAVATKLAKLDRDIERAAGRLLTVDDSLVPDLEKQLLALKDRREKLAGTIEALAMPLPSAKAIAAKLWELDRILAEAPATTIRTALAQVIDSIALDFEEMPRNRRGRHFAFAGGVIRLLPEGLQRYGRWFCAN